ncbi:MAG: hypothetical protein CM15mP46_4520 [Alphaproteobacteria bacterium]|nr:MAG: hypothetical protein CM15mP46_4520 [Alphaproteobacteria bacterium]
MIHMRGQADAYRKGKCNLYRCQVSENGIDVTFGKNMTVYGRTDLSRDEEQRVTALLREKCAVVKNFDKKPESSLPQKSRKPRRKTTHGDFGSQTGASLDFLGAPAKREATKKFFFPCRAHFYSPILC